MPKFLETFDSWVETSRQQFEEQNIAVEYVKPGDRRIPHSPARIIFETDAFIADIRVWDTPCGTGAYDIEVLDCETAEDILAERYDFETVEEMLVALDRTHTYLLDLFEIGRKSR